MQRKFLYIRFIAFSSQKLAPGGNQIFNGNNLLKTMAELNSSFKPPPLPSIPASIASYLSKQAKLPYLQKAVAKLDLLKFFLQISWEIKAMDTKKYISLSEKLDEIGKMLGGWIREFSKKKSPAGKGGE